MGVSCKISRKRDGSIEKVAAPNGELSSLYDQALELLGDEGQALEVWATAYTPQFVSYYGHWENPRPDEFFNLDINGEPKIDDVLSYLERDTCVTGSFTADDVKDVNNFVMSLGFSGADVLADSIRSAFYKNGGFVVDRASLTKSGLYTIDEINHILSGPDIIESVSDALRRFANNYANISDKDKADYYFSNDDNTGYVVKKTDSYNQFGKSEIYNPSEIDIVLRESVGGIKDELEFDERIKGTGIPELIDRYENDLDFRDNIFEQYSEMDEIPSETLTPEGSEPDSISFMQLRNYSYPNMSAYKESRAVIADAMDIDEDTDRKEIADKVRKVEKAAARFGIDIAGLSEKDVSVDDLISLFSDLDIYISGIHKGDSGYGRVLAESIDNVMGKRAGTVMKLPSYLKGKSVVMVNTLMSDKSMFHNMGYLKIGGNLYCKTGNMRGMSDEARASYLDSQYTSLAELAADYISVLPAEAYPSSVFKNGVVDKDKVRKTDKALLKSSIRRYVLSLTDTNNSEDMVVARIIIGAPLTDTADFNMQREFDRYMKSEGENVNPNDVDKLWRLALSSKLSDPALYRNLFMYLDFKDRMRLGLKTSDNTALRSIDLNSEGNTRKMLFSYAMSATDPDVSRLFYLEKNPFYYAGEDFYYYFYKRNPELLKEYKGNTNITEEGDTSIPGLYKDFVRIGNDVYMKIGEDYEGSVYRSSSESAKKTKNEFIQTRKVFEFSNIYLEGSTIKEEGSLKDNTDLTNLEC